MNADEFKGIWKQLKGQAKEKWGKLTDDDLTQVDGKKDKLIGFLQQKYGMAENEAEKAVDEWSNQLRKIKK
ncbi:MAG: CsbD family protein [Chlamydiales bacterium]|nr:CsbD family protein [Chlamydiales bacterium]